MSGTSTIDSTDLRTNLIVNYIPYSMDTDALHNLFSSIGNIKSCKVISVHGQHRGYGFVDYHSPQDAQKAIELLNKLRIEYKTLKVAYALPLDERKELCRLKEKLVKKDVFGASLEVLHRQPVSDKNKTYFPTKQHSQAMFGSQFVVQKTNFYYCEPLIEMNPRCHGQSVARSSQFPSSVLHWLPEPQGFVLFVSNLSPGTVDTDLWKLFAPLGAVEKIHVVHEKETNICKGYAFVTMLRFEEAAWAVSFLNMKTLNGNVLRVAFDKKDNRIVANH